MQINTNPHLMNGPGALDRAAAAIPAAQAGKDAKTSGNGWKTIGKGLDDVIGVGGEMAIPDEALRKDDPLGKLMAKAFGI